MWCCLLKTNGLPSLYGRPYRLDSNRRKKLSTFLENLTGCDGWRHGKHCAKLVSSSLSFPNVISLTNSARFQKLEHQPVGGQSKIWRLVNLVGPNEFHSEFSLLRTLYHGTHSKREIFTKQKFPWSLMTTYCLL